MPKNYIRISLADVKQYGSIAAAIAAWCDNTPEFETGPFDAFFAKAVVGRARYYIDSVDGQMLEATEEVITRLLDKSSIDAKSWTPSVVRIACPNLTQAIANPEETKIMAQSVIAYHQGCSDCAAWKSLIESIRQASSHFADIDTDLLETAQNEVESIRQASAQVADIDTDLLDSTE
jgi:hypothetical protein